MSNFATTCRTRISAKAIKYAVECWDYTGDEEMFRQLVDRVCGKLTQCTRPPAQRYYLSPLEFDEFAGLAFWFSVWLVAVILFFYFSLFVIAIL